MSFVSDLRSKVLAASPSLGSRVFWKYRGQATALPAVVLDFVGGRMDQAFDGPMSAQGHRVQASCLAKTKLEVEALRDAVAAALISPGTVGDTEFQGGFINLFRDTLDDAPDGVTHTEQIDATIWFN